MSQRTTSLLTDQYELTMVQAALDAGSGLRRSVFEVFDRRLDGRRYGVVAGTGRFLDALEHFVFGSAEIDFLLRNEIVDRATVDWLADYRFSGSIWGYREGEAYFPGSPVLIVEGTFAEAVLLETLALSILNHDSAIATAAARMVGAANGRPCLEMGSRRTHEEAAVAAARAAYVAGFASTSNLEAGRRYGIPTIGTSAHSFTLLHDSERDAFEAQLASLGTKTTLLVDTYDEAEAIELAIELTEGRLGAVRLDSGDLPSLARLVRKQLDGLGAHDTQIVVTSDLDEYALATLATAPVDRYGIGTRLVTGSGTPTAGMVYKLVARADDDGVLVDVAKKSKDKQSVGGRKHAMRRRGPDGRAEAEVIGIGSAPSGGSDDRPLLVQFVRDGERLVEPTLDQTRAHHRAALAELPPSALRLSPGEPAIPTVYEERA